MKTNKLMQISRSKFSIYYCKWE